MLSSVAWQNLLRRKLDRVSLYNKLCVMVHKEEFPKYLKILVASMCIEAVEYSENNNSIYIFRVLF